MNIGSIVYASDEYFIRMMSKIDTKPDPEKDNNNLLALFGAVKL